MPPSYQMVQLEEFLSSIAAAKFQQEVALHVLKAELADLNITHNKGRYEEVSRAIRCLLSCRRRRRQR